MVDGSANVEVVVSTTLDETGATTETTWVPGQKPYKVQVCSDTAGLGAYCRRAVWRSVHRLLGPLPRLHIYGAAAMAAFVALSQCTSPRRRWACVRFWGGNARPTHRCSLHCRHAAVRRTGMCVLH